MVKLAVHMDEQHVDTEILIFGIC